MLMGSMFLTVLAHGQQLRVDEQKLENFAQAVAKAEGFGVKGTIPTRCHNPGDLRSFIKGVHYPGQIGTTNHGYMVFKNDAAGFAALKTYIRKMASGESRRYTPEMSLTKIGRIYAGGAHVWAKNVSHYLGVEPTVTLASLLREEEIQPPDIKMDVVIPQALFAMEIPTPAPPVLATVADSYNPDNL